MERKSDRVYSLAQQRWSPTTPSLPVNGQKAGQQRVGHERQQTQFS
jgi:hypothetical protein